MSMPRHPAAVPARATPVTLVTLAMLVTLVLVLAGCTDRTDATAPPGPPDATSLTAPTGPDAGVVVPTDLTWSDVSAGPLSARHAPLVAWVADRFVVVGGWSGPACPPNAYCVPDPETVLSDGAAYDPESDSWEPIAPAPVALPDASHAVVGDVLYVLTASWWLPETPETLLAYDAAADSWAVLPPPPGRWSALVAAGDRLLAIPGTDEEGAQPDAVLDPSTGTWQVLPEDPLGPSYDRQAVWLGDRLLLAAKDLVPNPGSAEPSLVRLVELDAALTTWSAPRDTEILGGSAVVAGSGDALGASARVVFPDLGSADGGEVNGWGRSYPYGGILDPADHSWRDLGVSEVGGDPWTRLPALPVGGRVIVANGLLDPVTGQWSTLPALPGGELMARGVATNDDVVFAWGGATTRSAVADGYVLRP